MQSFGLSLRSQEETPFRFGGKFLETGLDPMTKTIVAFSLREKQLSTTSSFCVVLSSRRPGGPCSNGDDFLTCSYWGVTKVCVEQRLSQPQSSTRAPPPAGGIKADRRAPQQRPTSRAHHVNMTDNLPPLLFHVHSNNKHEMSKNDLRQVVAIAVISRLQEWCIQLLRITILCVIGVCGEESPGEQRTSSLSSPVSSQKRTNLAEIEMKVLRHLTSPQLIPRTIRQRRQKRRPASRPPSPQLFDIAEEE